MRRSDKVLFASLFFILGIAAQEIAAMPFFVLYILFIIALIFLLSGVFSKAGSLALKYLGIKIDKKIIFSLFIFFLGGAFWLSLRLPDDKENYKNITEGIVGEEPVLGEKFQDIIVRSEKLKEKVLIKTDLYPEYKYGDKLKFNCDFEPALNDDSYGRYLLKDGVRGICYYPEIEIISRANGNKFYSAILSLRQNANKTIERSVVYPESEILSAMLLGYKRQIPADLKDSFSKAGISHIVAISGMHLVIISFILVWILIEIGFWRRQIFYLALFLLWFYILLVGLPASAVRAGIMISVVLWGRHLGRASNLTAGLFVAAFAILLFNPLLLLRDIGFQLSFLAVFGIVYFSPIFSGWLKKVPEFLGLKKILIVTLAAQSLTLPLSVFYFGNIPFLSLAVNLLFIPVLPLVLVLGILIVSTGVAWPFGGFILGVAAGSILEIFVKLVRFFISLPLGFFYVEGVGLPAALLAYIFLFFFGYKIRKKQEFDFLFN